MEPPAKNKIGVAIRNGKKAFFSFLYRPGAINFHIWIDINGKEKNKAKKKAILSSVKKASCNAVYIKPCPFSVSNKLTKGAAKKKIIDLQN